MSFMNGIKKRVGFFFSAAALFQTTSLVSGEVFSLSAKTGAFFLLNGTARDLYGPVLPSFTLEANADVYKGLTLWVDGSYLFGNGSNFDGSSHLNFIPLSLGLKYVHSFSDRMDFYAGAGPCYSFLILRDRSPYVHKKTSLNNWGGVAKSGFVYRCTEHFRVEGFLNYMYQEFHFSGTWKNPFVYRTDAYLNGIEVGAGFGYQF